MARWECAQIGGEELAYEELRLVLIQDGAEQILATQLQNCGGLGAFGLGVVSWASDSRTLYYTQAREGVPDGLCWYWYPELFALAIESGQKTQLRQGPLSPDGSILAFWEDNDLVLWSLDRGEIARRPAAFPDLRPGPIAWAPDGQALAYIQNRSDCHPFGTSILVRLDLAANQETVLLQSETPSFTGVDWKTPNRLDLRDADRNLWWFNSYTQELTLVETPQPPL